MEDKFQRWVRETVESLPPAFKEKLQNIQIIVEDEPGVKVIKKYSSRYPASLLGLYQGVPLVKRRVYSTNMFPDKIIIFRRPIEKRFPSKKKRREAVIKTVLHEIGHFFGLSERELKK